MKSIEFMYWLQGYFEVCESIEINQRQYQVIKNHLNMVKIVDGKEMWPFCHWLEGVMDIINTPEPSKEQTLIIKNKLNGIFEHVVENKMNENVFPQKSSGMQLNPSETSELIRC
jgi:hypothetical protein